MARGAASWKLSSADNVVTAELEGEIDDQFDYKRLLDELEDAAFEQVTIDCGGISRLNSQGARSWLTFLRKLHDLHKEIVYIRCSVALVNRMNMVPAMAQDVLVASIFAPYACEETGEKTERLIDLGELSDPTSPPRYPHPDRAGAVFELDEDPERYFAFLIDTRTGMHPTMA